jgi:hypothetical protein
MRKISFFSLCDFFKIFFIKIIRGVIINNIKNFVKRRVEALDANVMAAIKKLWWNDVPSKVSIFGSRLSLERLPTRSALNRRGILLNPHDLSCIF